LGSLNTIEAVHGQDARNLVDLALRVCTTVCSIGETREASASHLLKRFRASLEATMPHVRNKTAIDAL
jgi:hypothetical protein